MVQFHAKLSPLTPHHRHTLMLQNQQRWLKTEEKKMDILMIWSSMRLRQCETVAHEQLWPDISMRWCWRCPIAQCAPLGGMCRWWENFNQFVTSPARPSPARHRYEGWEDTIFSVEVLCSMLWGTRFCAESLIIYEKSRGDRLGVFVQISKK